jgi:hypothetical protein
LVREVKPEERIVLGIIRGQVEKQALERLNMEIVVGELPPDLDSGLFPDQTLPGRPPRKR